MTYQTAHERLWNRVDKSAGPNACWEWQGAINSHGYGTIRQRCASRGCHVVAFESVHGPTTPGVVICHTCDNRKCCNPSHLYAGNHATNARDRVMRGRSNSARGEGCGQAKLRDADAAVIRFLAGCGVRQNKLGALFGVTQMAISNLVNRKTWAHVPDIEAPHE